MLVLIYKALYLTNGEGQAGEQHEDRLVDGAGQEHQLGQQRQLRPVHMVLHARWLVCNRQASLLGMRARHKCRPLAGWGGASEYTPGTRWQCRLLGLVE